MTAREVFETALDLINERGEDGLYSPDIKDYEKNVLSYLSILTISLYELDCRIKEVACHFDDDTPPTVTSLDDELSLHFTICRGALPYGLAFMLLLEEEPSRAETFHTLYEKECYRLEKLFTRGKRRRIKEVY